MSLLNFIFSAELPHFLLSVGLGLVLFWRYRQWQLVPLCLLTGILIDLDHFLDFYFFSGFKGNLGDMFKTDYFNASKKVYVLFHGWELVFLLWPAGRYLNRKFGQKGIEWALCLPYLGHLLIDQFSAYTANPLAYSLFFRILNGFSLEKFHHL